MPDIDLRHLHVGESRFGVALCRGRGDDDVEILQGLAELTTHAAGMFRLMTDHARCTGHEDERVADSRSREGRAAHSVSRWIVVGADLPRILDVMAWLSRGDKVHNDSRPGHPDGARRWKPVPRVPVRSQRVVAAG